MNIRVSLPAVLAVLAAHSLRAVTYSFSAPNVPGDDTAEIQEVISRARFEVGTRGTNNAIISFASGTYEFPGSIREPILIPTRTTNKIR
jgi:hypothetical protein